jgi:hypothetical protein
VQPTVLLHFKGRRKFVISLIQIIHRHHSVQCGET